MSSASPKTKPEGLAKTLELLGTTANEAAVAVLVPALDSPAEAVQEGSLRALLERRSVAGQMEILARLHLHLERWRPIIDHKRGRLGQALRNALLSSDNQLCHNATQAVLWFREYDLVATLLNCAEDVGHDHTDLCATTLVTLIDDLYQELTAPGDYGHRRDPERVRSTVLGLLEASLKRFAKHQRREIAQAYIHLASRDSLALRVVLLDTHHPVYKSLVEILLYDQHPSIGRLLLSFLDDPQMPAVVFNTLSKRGEAHLREQFLHKVSVVSQGAAAHNLKKIESLPWLQGDLSWIDKLNDDQQSALVKLVGLTSLKRETALAVLQAVARAGTLVGKVAALKALAHFQGADANAIVLEALHDSAPRVQAEVVRQLRTRGIPGALTKLIALADSPHEIVRTAVRSVLTEFTFDRFLGAFDLLSDDVRRSTGLMVKKINPQCLGALQEELRAPSRTRRLRGLALAESMEWGSAVERELLKLAEDEDHVMRAEVARVLAGCNTSAARAALMEMLHDRAVAVREAATASLESQGLDVAIARQLSPAQEKTQ
jgi:HEAT repeat protein